MSKQPRVRGCFFTFFAHSLDKQGGACYDKAKPMKQRKDGGLIPSERGAVLSHVFGAV